MLHSKWHETAQKLDRNLSLTSNKTKTTKIKEKKNFSPIDYEQQDMDELTIYVLACSKQSQITPVVSIRFVLVSLL